MPTRFCTYALTLKAPLLIPTGEGDPNSVRAAPYVPGSALRGAVAAALGAGSPRFEELILSRHVRFLNAYPTALGLPAPLRSLPVPLTWRAEKHAPEMVHDVAALEEGAQVPETVRPPYPFVIPGASLFGVRPAVSTSFHHQRDRVAGRATEERGAIFAYEAIEAGTRLVGVVAVEGEDEGEIRGRLEPIGAALRSGLRLGRSRRTQYGGLPDVEAWIAQGDREVAVPWSQLQVRDLQPGDRFRLLLTADAVVRHPLSGQLDPVALDQVVTDLLQNRAEVLERFATTRVVSGFNQHWRLALPQAPAAQSGGVLLLEARHPIPLADLLVIEAVGIGERRSEGFGACLFLGPPDPAVTLRTPPAPQPASRPEGLPAPDTYAGALLQQVQDRLFEAALERAVESLAAELSAGASSIPSRALLGRLRVPLRGGEAGLATLAAWLGRKPEEGELRQKAGEQLGKCRLTNGRHLDEWLRQLLNSSDPLDDLASGLFQGRPLARSSLSGAPGPEVRRRLAEQARPRLVDAVLALLAKERA